MNIKLTDCTYYYVLQDLNKSIYSKFISDTVDFLTTATQHVPTACLLTGLVL